MVIGKKCLCCNRGCARCRRGCVLLWPLAVPKFHSLKHLQFHVELRFAHLRIMGNVVVFPWHVYRECLRCDCRHVWNHLRWGALMSRWNCDIRALRVADSPKHGPRKLVLSYMLEQQKKSKLESADFGIQFQLQSYTRRMTM